MPRNWIKNYVHFDFKLFVISQYTDRRKIWFLLFQWCNWVTLWVLPYDHQNNHMQDNDNDNVYSEITKLKLDTIIATQYFYNIST